MPSPLGDPALIGAAGASACSSCSYRIAVQREVPLGHPVALQLLLDELPERVDPDLVDQDLDPGASAVDAQEVLAIEDPETASVIFR